MQDSCKIIDSFTISDSMDMKYPPCNIFYDSSHEASTFRSRFSFVALGCVGSVLTVAGVVVNLYAMLRISSYREHLKVLHQYTITLWVWDALLLATSWFTLALPAVVEHSSQQNRRYVVPHSKSGKVIMWFSRGCAIWTTMFLTVERFVSLHWPEYAESRMVKRRLLISSCATVVVSLALAIPLYFEGYYKSCCQVTGGFVDKAFVYHPDAMPGTLYHTVYTIFLKQVLINLGPFLVVSVLTAIMLWKMNLFKRRYYIEISPGLLSAVDRYNKILLYVIVKFVLLNLVPVACDFIEVFDTKHQAYLSYVVDIGNVLVLLHSATNGLVYLLFCGKETTDAAQRQSGQEMQPLQDDGNRPAVVFFPIAGEQRQNMRSSPSYGEGNKSNLTAVSPLMAEVVSTSV